MIVMIAKVMLVWNFKTSPLCVVFTLEAERIGGIKIRFHNKSHML